MRPRLEMLRVLAKVALDETAENRDRVAAATAFLGVTENAPDAHLSAVAEALGLVQPQPKAAQLEGAR